MVNSIQIKTEVLIKIIETDEDEDKIRIKINSRVNEVIEIMD